MPFKDKETARQWRDSNKSKIKTDHQKWKEENPEKLKEYQRQERLHPQRLERVMLSNAKKRAKKYGLEFSLELSDIFIPEFCPLLPHIKLNQSGQEHYVLSQSSPTLDRKDNSKGYVKGNVWVISWKANTIKNDSSLEELETLTRNLRKETKP